MDDKEYKDAVVDDILYLIHLIENIEMFTKAGDDAKLDILDYLDSYL